MWNIAFSLDFETKVWGVPLLSNSFKQSTNWRRKQRWFHYNFIPCRAAFVNVFNLLQVSGPSSLRTQSVAV